MTKKKTDVAVITTNSIPAPKEIKDVPATIKAFEAQLAELKKGAPEAVSLNIEYNGTNIKDVTKAGELLEISSSIHARAAAYQVEVARYGLEGKVQPFKVSEKTAEEWKEILDKAIFELLNATQIKKIEDAIKKLSKFEDEKSKFAREMSEIVASASELLS